MPDRVERAAEHRACLGRDALGEGPRALGHLARGPAREREQQYPLGRDPLGEQPCDARAQRGRLAGAGAREDQQRVAGVRRRLALLRVELL